MTKDGFVENLDEALDCLFYHFGLIPEDIWKDFSEYSEQNLINKVNEGIKARHN